MVTVLRVVSGDAVLLLPMVPSAGVVGMAVPVSAVVVTDSTVNDGLDVAICESSVVALPLGSVVTVFRVVSGDAVLGAPQYLAFRACVGNDQ